MELIKKISKAALILALAVSITSCGNKKIETNGNEDKNSDQKEDNVGKKDTKESADDNTDDIPTLMYYNVGTPQEGTPEVIDAINKYLDSQNAGYHLNMQYFDRGDYQQKLQLASNAGDDRDIAFTASRAGPYKNMAGKGAFLDITDLIKEKGEAILDSASEYVIKGASIDERLYGTPAAADNIVPADYFVWNKQYVDKYNIPIEDIKTIKQLDPYLKEVKENEASVEYPFKVASDFLLQTPMPQSEATQGVAVKEEDGKLVAYNAWDNPQMKETLFAMKDYMDKGYIDPSAPQINAGEVGAGDSRLVLKAEGGVNSDDIRSRNFDTEVVSSFAGEAALITNEKATGSLAAINSQSEHPDLAMDFLNRMYSDKELMRYLANGIEGKNYELVDGKIKRIEDSGYDVPAFTFLASDMMTPSVDSPDSDTPERKEALDKFLDRLKPSPILGFNFDREKSPAEVENVEQVIDEYQRNLKTGAFDDAYYNEFLEKLQKAGIDKLIDEVQAQLDAWKK